MWYVRIPLAFSTEWRESHCLTRGNLQGKAESNARLRMWQQQHLVERPAGL